jgi:8-oxo-dGTP pyrophosphatase MutT (NUDIX family)
MGGRISETPGRATSGRGYRYGSPVSRFPEPGEAEAVNLGTPTVPRPAATVVLTRDSADDGSLEVLLLRRSAESKFMPNVWVFPGGSLDAGDGEGEHGLRACARRELAEEAGVELHPEAEIVTLSRWITPEVVQTRFDTWFFLAQAPHEASVQPDGFEMTAAMWINPAAAVEQSRREELAIVFPTLKQLEALAHHPHSQAAVDAAMADESAATPILPKVIGDLDEWKVVLPDDPDYPED